MSAPDKRQDNTVFPRARALINHLYKYNRTISSKKSLVIKQQAILAAGMDGHCCTHLKEKQQPTKCPVPIVHSKKDFSR
jgi:hypothetical protein